MFDKDEWFTETFEGSGFGCGLKITQCLHEEQTPYQHIAIYETTNFGNLMVIDGCIMLTSRDNFLYHEMMSHPALFTHPNPQNVVIIGGGDCGTLKEVLKHPVASAIQIEIDEAVTENAKRYFPELTSSNADPRATLKFIDGVKWMKEAESNSTDIIIVDSTDPVGPAEGLFNTAFYRECFRVLTEDGILVQQSESPLIHQPLLQAMRQSMQEADFTHLLTLPFPQPVYPSGWWSATMAAKKPLFPQFRRDEGLLDKLKTLYYHFPLHEGLLTPSPFLKRLFKQHHH